MRHLSIPLVLSALASLGAAQNCLDGNVGTLIGTDTTDAVLPIQPIGFPFPLGGQTYTDVHITDHGFVQLSNGGTPAPATGAVLYTPTTANFVAGSPKLCALYADIVGTGGGRIYINSSPTQCTVTWRNMQNFGTPTPRFDFQLVMFPNGDFRVAFGPNVTNVSTFGVPSDNGICGATPGANAALPTAVDLSTGGASVDNTTYELWTVPMSFDLANQTLLFVATNPGYTFINLGAAANCGTASDYGTGCFGLSMTSVGAPQLGNAGYALRITGALGAALVAFGDTAVNPGLPLGSIGMSGCSGYTNLGIGLFTSGPVASGVSDFPLVIPSSPALVGSILAAQGVSFTVSTALGLNASNGTLITVGY
jgi:hypothetical protein